MRRSAYGLLERFASAEPRDAAIADGDGGAGLWIARFARLAARRFEGAEADERDAVALLQRLRHRLDQRLEDAADGDLRQFCVLGDLRHDLLFVHGPSSSVTSPGSSQRSQ